MIALHEQYVIDSSGKKTAIVLPLNEWEKVLTLLEELDDIQAYDLAKSHPSDPVSF
jgi:hypothetical protein